MKDCIFLDRVRTNNATQTEENLGDPRKSKRTQGMGVFFPFPLPHHHRCRGELGIERSRRKMVQTRVSSFGRVVVEMGATPIDCCPNPCRDRSIERERYRAVGLLICRGRRRRWMERASVQIALYGVEKTPILGFHTSEISGNHTSTVHVESDRDNLPCSKFHFYILWKRLCA